MVEVDCEYLRFSQVPQILMILTGLSATLEAEAVLEFEPQKTSTLSGLLSLVKVVAVGCRMGFLLTTRKPTPPGREIQLVASLSVVLRTLVTNNSIDMCWASVEAEHISMNKA